MFGDGFLVVVKLALVLLVYLFGLVLLLMVVLAFDV